MSFTKKNEAGVALIITLCLLVVATILVTGFLASMRTERQASQAMANSQLTDVIAQDAVQHAAAILDTNIPQPVVPGQAGTAQNWIVSPGLLTVVTGADGTTPKYVPLSTNPSYASQPTDPTQYVNLNAAIPGSNPVSYYVMPTTTNEELRATWVYVLQNPLAPASATNPVVGRYAFWMDDENAKINVNTAYGKPTALQTNTNQIYRTNPLDGLAPSTGYEDVGFDAYRSSTGTETYPGDSSHKANATVANAVGTATGGSGTETTARLYPIGHPSAINIDLLGPSLNRNALADWIFNGPSNNASTPSGTTNALTYLQANGGKYRPLTSPEQIMQFVSMDGTGKPTDPLLFQNNKFNLTAYNRAPEFNAFGKPRLLLESRIRSKSTGGSNDSMNSLGVSGAETEFYQTPDFDANGPMYFHGDDNTTAGSHYIDLGSVQMVADYLSNLLNRNDWPGMPTRSFVDKWGGDDNARREADQVAWNIVSMGNYAPNLEYSGNNTQDWPDGYNLVFMKTTNPATPDTNSTISPTESLVSNQTSASPTPAVMDPNRCLRVGALSKKAIMPFNGRPHMNEVALVINAVPKSSPAGTFALAMTLQTELYAGKRCPPGTFWSHFNLYFDLTHLFYTITDTAGHRASQSAVGSSNGGDFGVSDGYLATNGQNAGGGVKCPFIYPLQGVLEPGTTAVVPADGYMVLATSVGKGIYAASGTATVEVPASTGTTPPVPPTTAVGFQGMVNVTFKARIALYAGTGNSYRTWEIVPVWDNVNCDKSALQPPTSPQQNDSITWSFSIDLSSLSTVTGGTFTRSLEIADARLGGGTHDKNGGLLWKMNQSASDPEAVAIDSLGGINTSTTPAVVDDYAWLDAQNAFYPNCPRPSIGMLSCIPTGMQRGVPASTLTFGPSLSKADLPDWLLLDLLAPTLQDTLQPIPAPLSYLHSTMGKININALINPLYPSPISSRTLPMQALFKNMVSDGLPLTTLAGNVINHRLSGLDYGAQGQYDYIGELCEVAGVADSGTTSWQKETNIRNLANLLTTNSNTFKVYGLAQAISIRKQAGNTNYGAFETGDTLAVNGERRFESVIERGVWPGVDGVPGNAHATNGVYDQISQSSAVPPSTLPWAGVTIPKSTWGTGTWATFDGPDDPRSLRGTGYDALSPGWYTLSYTSSPLKSAVNPARAHMTYKPISFRYVTN